ncbi:toll/interleukin-1 receptor domain-containing protein [Arsenicibacter rosenii]|uniref:TIR domain-containing protein n=1 Tax=Arsenicibacter rosenii TaxID=1750698 RepID=A0A1S2VMI3_9BACT|nr:toll/interleukin-1 receptor domain-containing protein [Arsenicibacter rosenii]OIN59964.1 hypothetical protein BLX24_09005 [Arsenicibacter rosenii]
MPFNVKHIPEDLLKSIISKKAVAFCGAGLSMPIQRSNSKNLPNWPQLLLELIELAHRDRYNFSGLLPEIELAVKNGNLLAVAQELQEVLSKPSIAKYLRDIFLDKKLKPNQTHKILVQIPFIGILTTNYDTLIEGAYTLKRDGRIPVVLTQEDLDKVPNPLKLDDEFVFKMHGDINRPETIILGSHDYQNILFRSTAYRSFLETLFTINTVLFVGFSMSDPDVENLLERLSGIYSRNNDFHYLLVERGRLNEFEKKRLALDKRIFTIEYNNHDGTHSEVYDFLFHLNELTSLDGKYRREYESRFYTLPVSQTNVTRISAFISYSGHDKEYAVNIAELLSENGIHVWMDDFNVKVGDTVVSTIESGIKESDYFIVLLSNNSINSDWVKQEIELAYITNHERNKPKIIPIVFDSLIRNKIPKLLMDIRWLVVNESNIFQKIQRLIEQLKAS